MRFALSIITGLVLAITVSSQTAKVTHVSDGDSFIIATHERVRMIGINAPERGDKFGPESRDHLARLIRGKSVTLESDPLTDDRDRHGRLLRFVSLDGTDINRRMIADGYAYAFLRYPFDKARREAYREAERSAAAARVGLWRQSPSDDVNSKTAAPTKTPETIPESNRASEGGARRSCSALFGILLLAIAFSFRFRRKLRGVAS